MHTVPVYAAMYKLYIAAMLIWLPLRQQIFAKVIPIGIIMFLFHHLHPFFGKCEISEIHGENARIKILK